VLLGVFAIQDYDSTPVAKMMPDNGIQVSVKFNDVTDNFGAFIGLGNNTAGQMFKVLATNAVQYAKK